MCLGSCCGDHVYLVVSRMGAQSTEPTLDIPPQDTSTSTQLDTVNVPEPLQDEGMSVDVTLIAV